MGTLDLSGWDRREAARRDRARQTVERTRARLPLVCEVLRAHGILEAWLFGSIARGDPRPGSDVDIAVRGCAPGAFFRLAAELERALDAPLDLVDLDLAPESFSAEVRARGERLL